MADVSLSAGDQASKDPRDALIEDMRLRGAARMAYEMTSSFSAILNEMVEELTNHHEKEKAVLQKQIQQEKTKVEVVAKQRYECYCHLKNAIAREEALKAKLEILQAQLEHNNLKQEKNEITWRIANHENQLAGTMEEIKLMEEKASKDKQQISKLEKDLTAALQEVKKAQRETGKALSQFCLIEDNCEELKTEVRKAREALECETKKRTSVEGELSTARSKIRVLMNIIDGSKATANNFETSIDLLTRWVVGNDGSTFRCSFQGCKFTSSRYLNNLFGHLRNNHFDEFKTMHEQVRIGILQVLEGKNEPDWAGWRIYHEDMRLLGSEPLNMEEFCARFLKKCRGSDTRFACEYTCAGGTINSVADFLEHFDHFHPAMLELLHDDVLKYIRQTNLQAEPFMKLGCETPISNAASASKPLAEVNVKIADELAKTLEKVRDKLALTLKINDTLEQKRTEMAMLEDDLEGAQVILKSKAKEVKDLQREIEHMKPCFRVGRAICDRKMQKQLYTRERDKAAISLGNSAAHHGTVRADASLFAETQFDGNKRCQDPEAFILMYGIDPQFVIRFDKNVGFIEMVDWRGSMKDFFKGDSYFQTTFHSSYEDCIQRIRDTWFMEPFEEAQKALNEAMKTEDFIEDLKVMKWEYQIAKQVKRQR